MLTDRTEWIDYAKGIGIILVVYAHLLSSGFHADLAIPRHFFILSDSGVYSFHMPLFFFLAGIFVQQSLDKRGVSKFLLNKLQLIAYPYLIWSLIQGFAELLFSQQSHRGVTFYNLLSIPYIPLAQFWFLYALFLMYSLFTLCYFWQKFSSVVVLSLALILFFYPIHTEVMALHGFSTGFFFFAIGVLLIKYWPRIETVFIPFQITLICFFLLLGSIYIIFEYVIEPTRLTDGSHPFYFIFLSFLGIFFCIGISQFLSRKKTFRMVKIFGLHSIQIYLVHMLAGVSVRIILLGFFSIENPVIHMVLGVSGGLVIPIVLYKFALKIRFPYLFQLKKRVSTEQ